MQARSAVTTKPVKGPSELGIQIAKLMAALTRAGQDNSPGSTPNSPRCRGHGRGRADRTTSGHPNSHNGQIGLGQAASVHSISTNRGTSTIGQGQGNAQEPKNGQGNAPNKKDPIPFSVSNVKVGATWPGSALPQPNH